MNLQELMDVSNDSIQGLPLKGDRDLVFYLSLEFGIWLC